jgi:dihydrofolate reductase
MEQSRELILYIAQSLDGYIAPADEDLSFLNAVAMDGEDYGYADFVATCDTVIMGRRTYDKVASMGIPDPHPERMLYVITSRSGPSTDRIRFHTGDPVALAMELKARSGKHIYCDGGAQLIHALADQDLIDRYIISTVPVLLGGGIRLFREGRPQHELTLVRTHAYTSGLVKGEWIRAQRI